MDEKTPIGKIVRIEDDRFFIEAPIENFIKLVGSEENFIELLKKSGYDFIEIKMKISEFKEKDE